MALVVLMYHGTPNSVPDEPFDVSLAMFKQQITALIDSGVSFTPFSKAFDPENFEDRTKVCITFDDGNANNLPAIEFLNQLGIVAAQFVVADWSSNGVGYNGRTDYLRSADLRDIRTICEIGGHGGSHRPLGRLAMEHLKSELAASKDFLSGVLDEFPSIMSFPGGVYDADSVAEAHNAGFRVIGNSVFDINVRAQPTVNRIAMLATSGPTTALEHAKRPKIVWSARRMAKQLRSRLQPK